MLAMSWMTIGQLARRVGVRPSAIRYYEAHGVLGSPPRSPSDYRLYGSDAIAQLRFVVRAKELGFSLNEVRLLLESSKKDPPCVLCCELIERHLAEIEAELRRLRSLRDRLRRLARQPRTAAADSSICPLIENEQPPHVTGTF
jgi:DNA-binding transcriptional MerR regulator